MTPMNDTPNSEKAGRPKVRLLNAAHCREFILHYAAANRPKFTRVSLDFLLRLEARLKVAVEDEIRRHPSLGVTLK